MLKGEDKTKEVNRIYYKDGKWHVVFNTGKLYEYGYKNVEKLCNPKKISTTKKEIRVSSEYVYNVYQVLIFGQYAKLYFYDQSTKVVYMDYFEMIDKDEFYKSIDTFSYLKNMSDVLKIKVEDDESFLGKQFSKMNEVPFNSVLFKYINKIGGKNKSKFDGIIMPFGLNISQEKAVKNAMNQQISLIEGPPGTGKTQTILNIIANSIIRNKSIAITSNNNSATSNVQEKLEEHGLGFISAFLGSKENKRIFIEKQTGVFQDLSEWSISKTILDKMYINLNKNLNDLLRYNELANEQAVCKQVLNDITKEYNHYIKGKSSNETYDNKRIKKMTEKELGRLIYTIQTKKITNTFSKIVFFLQYKVRHSIVFRKNTSSTLEKLNRQFYVNTINVYKKKIKEISTNLTENDFKKKLREYEKKSMKYFKGILACKYDFRRERNVYSNKDIYFDFELFLKDYPVILSTTHSLKNSSNSNYIFDLVVIDEASQSDIVSGALALSVAENAVIVGDVKQLPHVVKQNIMKISESILDNYILDNAYNYKYSLLESMKLLYNSSIPTVLLREHYRCVPEIIGFCNKMFYNSELIIHTESSVSNAMSVYVSVEGNHARGRFNQRQIDIIVNEVIPTLELKSSIGIITPYRDQRESLLRSINNNNIEIDTVHKFQGREKNIIIISTVDNIIKPGSFIDDRKLINVAISRAKEQLVLVTSNDIYNNGKTNISDLVEYIKYNNFEITDSKVLSVFDALYKHQSENIRMKYEDIEQVSKYKSENLVNQILREIIREEEFLSLSYILQYPLNDLVLDYESLNNDEIKYAKNHLTQVDFLVYSKASKKPLLVIEVDGYAYHNESKVQMRRDNLKNSILNKSELKILRLNTTGSNEKSRIMKKLREI